MDPRIFRGADEKLGDIQFQDRADLPYASGLTGVDLFSRPVPRHEVIEAVDLVICDAGENPAKPCFGIDTVHAAGLDERITVPSLTIT